MEQKVRICLQFSNPNQGGGPPSSANPLQTLRRWPHITADISDQHEPAFPFPTAHHHRRRTYPPRHERRGTNTSREALPKRQRRSYTGRPAIPSRRHRHVDRIPYNSLVSLYFSPLFPARAPFRSVRRVCRTTCPPWPRMHLSNGETNW